LPSCDAFPQLRSFRRAGRTDRRRRYSPTHQGRQTHPMRSAPRPRKPFPGGRAHRKWRSALLPNFIDVGPLTVQGLRLLREHCRAETTASAHAWAVAGNQCNLLSADAPSFLAGSRFRDFFCLHHRDDESGAFGEKMKTQIANRAVKDIARVQIHTNHRRASKSVTVFTQTQEVGWWMRFDWLRVRRKCHPETVKRTQLEPCRNPN
jgi:hypothetical protein